MPSYSKDLVINAPKEMLLRLMTDPFLVTGIFGHVGLLKVYDAKQGGYVDFNKLTGFSNRFLAIYIFGTPEEKIEFYKGELEGPVFESGSILYRGWTMERKFTWEARFEASYIKPNQTLVRVLASCEYRLSTLEKILGKTPFALAQHLVEDHIVPYINYYLKTKGEAEIEEVTPVKLLDEQGLFSQILPKVTETVKDVEYGVVAIRGEKLNGKMTVKNGTISGIELNDNGKIMQGENAMLYLVSLPQQVRVSVYSINLDNLISVNLDKDVIKTNANVNLNQKF